jgi:hypothetical protein
MIDFEYWFASIVGTCELIASEDAFRKAWIDGDHRKTSIHYYDELCVQLTDGLRLSENIRAFAPLINEQETIEALNGFSRSLRAIDQSIESDPQLNDPKVLLSSAMWAIFKESARRVVTSRYAEAYRNGRKDSEILQKFNQQGSHE